MRIAVVGLGTVGSVLQDYDGFYGVRHQEIEDCYVDFSENPYADFRETDAIVNCAGIAGAGKCSKAEIADIMEANVMFPQKLQRICKESNTLYIHISTAGVYQKQAQYTDNFGWGAPETYPTYPHNLSVASEILGENHLFNDLQVPIYILRLSWFLNEEKFYERAKYMTDVQQIWTSITHPDTLVDAIRNVVEKRPDPGIYNINSETVWLPDFMRQSTKKPFMEKKDHPKDMTSTVPTSTRKAIEAGLLCEKM